MNRSAVTPSGAPYPDPMTTALAGPVALVGSGEYLPALEHVDRALLDGRPPRFVQLATAAAPEGPAVLARWRDLGAAAAARLGVEQVVVPVLDRDDAMDAAHAALVAGAGLVYLSGGNPLYLTETLRDSAVWHAIVEAWRGGSALAGCSAGAMALSAAVPDLRHLWRGAAPGLGLLPTIEVLPHFDAFAARLPDLVLRRVAGAPDGVQVVGIDENTALVGGLGGWRTENGSDGEPVGPGSRWQVMGLSSVWILDRSGRHGIGSGEWTRLPVPQVGGGTGPAPLP